MKTQLNFQYSALEARAIRILDLFDANFVVLNHHGVIIATNENWRLFAENNQDVNGSFPSNTEEGTNYLDICLSAVGPSAEGALLVYEGIRAVLEGKLKTFNHDYPCHSPEKKRWFSLTVKPLRNTKPREVVVIHEDITVRTMVEIEYQSKQHKLVDALSQLQTLVGDIKNYLYLPQASLPFASNSSSLASTTQEVALLQTLSERELEVLTGIIRGERNGSIAQRLGLSVKSVSTYRSRILKKLKLDSNADLIAFSSRAGYL